MKEQRFFLPKADKSFYTERYSAIFNNLLLIPMKKLICFLTILLTVATLNNVVFAAEQLAISGAIKNTGTAVETPAVANLPPPPPRSVQNYSWRSDSPGQWNPTEMWLETVPIRKSAIFTPLGWYELSIVGTWEDGTTNRPTIFFNAVSYDAEKRKLVREAEAAIDAAIREKTPVRFFITKAGSPALASNEFNFYKISYRGITIELGKREMGAEKTSASTRLPIRFPTDLPEKGMVARVTTGTGIEVRTPETFRLPESLDDYTIAHAVRWGIEKDAQGGVWLYYETRRDYMLLEARRTKNVITLLVQERGPDTRTETVVLDCGEGVTPQRLWVTQVQPSELDGPVEVLTKRATAKGVVKPPMLAELVTSSASLPPK